MTPDVIEHALKMLYEVFLPNHVPVRAGITGRVSCHTLRHSFAAHLLEACYDIRTVQELLGRQNLQTTMIYTHVATKNILRVQSPLDKWEG